MILVLNLNQRECDEIFQAVGDHARSLEEHKVNGRAKTTRIVGQKLAFSYEESRLRQVVEQRIKAREST